MKKFLVLLLPLIMLSCRQEIPELPDETQYGANTFGCLVNGELVLPFNQNYGFSTNEVSGPLATYYPSINELHIIGYGQHNQAFYFTIINPCINQTLHIDTAMYYPPGIRHGQYYGGNNTGEITLSCFDATSMVVSGKFQFIGCKSSDENKKVVDHTDFVTISHGRFDIKLTIERQ